MGLAANATGIAAFAAMMAELEPALTGLLAPLREQYAEIAHTRRLALEKAAAP